MSNLPTYERPNTVSGLMAKHKELSKLRDLHRAEIRKLTVDIDHLDAAIRLFDPQTDRGAIKEHVTRHRAEKGSVKRFVLNFIREASGPVTSRQITEAWAEDRGLKADEATYAILRKRVGSCIQGCVGQGLLEDTGWTDDHEESGPYKLWALKEGAL